MEEIMQSTVSDGQASQPTPDNATLESLLRNVPGGIIMYRWDGERLKTMHISDFYARQYGQSLVSRDANPGGPDFGRIHPDDVAAYRKAIVEALTHTHKIEYTYRVWNSEAGRYLWTKMNAVSELQPDGSSYCYVMYSDITEQQDAVERERCLSRCLELMTDDSNIEKNLAEVMRLVERQYCAARVYIFEFDWQAQTMSNTYEFTAPDVTQEKNNLQDMPISFIDHWMPNFRRGEAVFIDDVEAIRDVPGRRDEYEALKPQGIDRLMTLPIIKNDHLYGYVGVDNPGRHARDKAFLTSVAYILSQEFFNRDQQAKLRELSLRDPLSHLKNRHAYNQLLEAMDTAGSQGTGVLFADVNGLKYVNDSFGHREGDKLICLAAEILEKHFDHECIYRISGDEFVVIVENTPEQEFLEKGERLKQDVLDVYGSIFAVGMIWELGKVDVSDMINCAEGLMYENKQAYYNENPLKKRRNLEELCRR